MSEPEEEPAKKSKRFSLIAQLVFVALIILILLAIALPAYQDRTYRNDIPAIVPEVYLEMGGASSATTDSLTNSEDITLLDNVSRPTLEWQASMFDQKSDDRQRPSALPLDRQYRFLLELTAAKAAPETQRFELSKALTHTLVANLLSRGRVQLEAVLLTDPEFLRLKEGESGYKTIDIDLSQLKWKNSSAEDAVAKALGGVEYALASGSTNGWTYVAVVLIKDNRALDQVIAWYCVGECEGEVPSGRAPGPDTLGALLNAGTKTDAALFLTEIAAGHLHGVFFVANPIDGRRVWTWSTRLSGAGFLADLKTMVAKSFQNFDTPPTLLLERGENLADFVFPPAPDANEARAAFQKFVGSSPVATAVDQVTPTLFVKFDFYAPEGLLIVPIGLMAMEFSPGKKEFLGRRVMIEQPLLHPKYSRGDACPSDWVALLPGDTAEVNLKIAQAALNTFRSDWTDTAGLKVHNKVSDFRNWLREEKPRGPTSLMTLSHHDDNRLFFFDDREDIYAANVRSRYLHPSIAILMGCSTGKPGATRFVTSFNTQGVETVVVANFDLHPAVAGTYIGCFNDALASARTNVSIDAVHFNAVNHCRWPKPAPRLSSEETAAPLSEEIYSANAMKLSMLGNGKVRVCRVPPSGDSDGGTP